MAITAQANIQEYVINGVNGGPVLSGEVEILTETLGLTLTKTVVATGTTNPISTPVLGDSFDILYNVSYSGAAVITPFKLFTLTDDVFKTASATYITLTDPTSIKVNNVAGTEISVTVIKNALLGTMAFTAVTAITQVYLEDGITIRIPAKAIKVETTSTVSTKATFSTSVLLSSEAIAPSVDPTEDALVVQLDSPQKDTAVAIGGAIVYNLTLSNASSQNALSVALGEQVIATITGFTVNASWTDTNFEVDGAGNIVAKVAISLDAASGATPSITANIAGTRTA